MFLITHRYNATKVLLLEYSIKVFMMQTIRQFDFVYIIKIKFS